nr:MAG TPA: helix-turn-helix domain protein [Caudoviricetes sp.]
MTFAEQLQMVMQREGLNRKQVCKLTGKSKATICNYLTGKSVPPEYIQELIMTSLQENEAADDGSGELIPIQRLTPDQVGDYMGLSPTTVRKGLQDGVFPWGYGIQTSPARWTYFINAKNFARIEGVNL